MKGRLFVFEGGEGCGKTTQVEMLELVLLSMGFDVCVTHEPGDTWVGNYIRQMLLEKATQLDPFTELSLFIADRKQHVIEVIAPALQAGKIVLCDRYVWSTIAYQGFGRGLDLELIGILNDEATFYREKSYFPFPDIGLTFWLNIEPELALTRKSKLDRIEQENLNFHKEVYKGYATIQKNNYPIIVDIDAMQSKEEVHHQILKIVTHELLNRR